MPPTEAGKLPPQSRSLIRVAALIGTLDLPARLYIHSYTYGDRALVDISVPAYDDADDDARRVTFDYLARAVGGPDVSVRAMTGVAGVRADGDLDGVQVSVTAPGLGVSAVAA